MNTMEEWWMNLNDTWSEEPTTYLTAGNNKNPQENFMGDLVFHRFFGADEDNPKDVKVVLVEAKKWNQWNQWLEKNRNKRKLFVPKYVHPIESVIMSRKSFRIIKWVDEYRPYDLFPNN